MKNGKTLSVMLGAIVLTFYCSMTYAQAPCDNGVENITGVHESDCGVTQDFYYHDGNLHSNVVWYVTSNNGTYGTIISQGVIGTSYLVTVHWGGCSVPTTQILSFEADNGAVCEDYHINVGFLHP